MAVGVLALAVVLGLAPGHDPSRATSAQVAGSLRLSAEVADPGSVIKARGRIASKSKRRVVLQRRVRGSWRPVAAGKSTRRGRYVLVTTLPKVPRKTVRYRVKVPRRIVDGRVQPRRFTPVDTVRTTAAVPTAAPTPPPPNPPPSPPPTLGPVGPVVAGWEMNEAAGSTTMVDSSGRGHHGAISRDAAVAGLRLNGTYYAWSTRCRDCPPVASPRVVQVPDSPDLEIPDPAVGYALEFRFATTAAYGNLIQKGQSNTAGGQIKVQDPVSLSCVFKGASGRTVVARGTRPLNDGLWHTVTCTHTATSVSQWVDGVLVSRTGSSAGRIDNSYPFVIGGKTECDQRSVGCDYFSGMIDWTRISRG